MSFEKIKDKHVELMTEKKEKTTADEMFEALGFRLVNDSPSRCDYTKNIGSDVLVVRFGKREGKYAIFLQFSTYNNIINVDLKLHRAIHQKARELWWLE